MTIDERVHATRRALTLAGIPEKDWPTIAVTETEVRWLRNNWLKGVFVDTNRFTNRFRMYGMDCVVVEDEKCSECGQLL